MFGECLPYLIWPSHLVWSAVGVFLLFLQFFLPFLILIFCYGRIVWVLSKRIGSNISSGVQGNISNHITSKENAIIIENCIVIAMESTQRELCMPCAGLAIGSESIARMNAGEFEER